MHICGGGGVSGLNKNNHLHALMNDTRTGHEIYSLPPLLIPQRLKCRYNFIYKGSRKKMFFS